MRVKWGMVDEDDMNQNLVVLTEWGPLKLHMSGEETILCFTCVSRSVVIVVLHFLILCFGRSSCFGGPFVVN
jgi:hypothetical protein